MKPLSLLLFLFSCAPVFGQPIMRHWVTTNGPTSAAVGGIITNNETLDTSFGANVAVDASHHFQAGPTTAFSNTGIQFTNGSGRYSQIGPYTGPLSGISIYATNSTSANSLTDIGDFNQTEIAFYEPFRATFGTRTFSSDGTHTLITNTATLTGSEWTAGSQFEWYNGTKTITIDKTNGNITLNGNLSAGGNLSSTGPGVPTLALSGAGSIISTNSGLLLAGDSHQTNGLWVGKGAIIASNANSSVQLFPAAAPTTLPRVIMQGNCNMHVAATTRYMSPVGWMTDTTPNEATTRQLVQPTGSTTLTLTNFYSVMDYASGIGGTNVVLFVLTNGVSCGMTNLLQGVTGGLDFFATNNTTGITIPLGVRVSIGMVQTNVLQSGGTISTWLEVW